MNEPKDVKAARDVVVTFDLPRCPVRLDPATMNESILGDQCTLPAGHEGNHDPFPVPADEWADHLRACLDYIRVLEGRVAELESKEAPNAR